jgi:hypothetical protein
MKTLINEFNDNLKIIYKLLNNRGTTNNIELSRLCQELFGTKFHGVYPSDRIPKLDIHRKYCILNLDKSTETGSHWVGCILDNDIIYIFDTYNRSVKQILPAIYKFKNNTIRKGEKHVLEKDTGTDCGERCIAWLLLVDKYGIDIAKNI